VLLLGLLFSACPTGALIIALPHFLGHRIAQVNDLACLSGGQRGPIHIAQLIGAIFFQDGPDAIEQVGSTRT
jgi:hypothetical protein